MTSKSLPPCFVCAWMSLSKSNLVTSALTGTDWSGVWLTLSGHSAITLVLVDLLEVGPFELLQRVCEFVSILDELFPFFRQLREDDLVVVVFARQRVVVVRLILWTPVSPLLSLETTATTRLPSLLKDRFLLFFFRLLRTSFQSSRSSMAPPSYIRYLFFSPSGLLSRDSRLLKLYLPWLFTLLLSLSFSFSSICDAPFCLCNIIYFSHFRLNIHLGGCCQFIAKQADLLGYPQTTCLMLRRLFRGT